MEGSRKVRRKYRETAMKKSKNKYEYAEYDVIRVIIVIIAGTARLSHRATDSDNTGGPAPEARVEPRPAGQLLCGERL